MTSKPQAPEAAEVVTQDLPDTDKAIAAEVPVQVAAKEKEERTTWREDLQELYWLKQIEMAEAVIQLAGCIIQDRADGAESKHVLMPKALTDADLRAQRIQAERAKLLSKAKREEV